MSDCATCLRKLKKGEVDFCSFCRDELFSGAAVTSVLPFTAPASATVDEMLRLHELTRQISVSGVQEKFSLRLAVDLEHTTVLELSQGN